MGPGPVPIAPSIKPTVPVIQPLPSPDTEQLEEEAATLVEESQKLAQALTHREKAEEITSEQISETEAVEEMPEVPEIDLELPSDEGFSDDISKLQELALQMEAKNEEMENEAEEIDTQSTAVPKSSKASKRKACKKSTAKPAKVSSISLGTPSDEGFGDDMDSLKDLISKMESAESESNNEQKAETAENLEDLSQYFGNVNESQEKSEENVEIESKGNEEIDSENLTAAISKILKDTLDMTGGLIGLELLLDELKDAGFPNLKKIEIMEIMDELKKQQVILDENKFFRHVILYLQ